MNSDQRIRARIILSLIVLGAIFLSSTLYWIQIHKGDVYTAKALRQYDKPALALFNRGNIYFKAKDGTKVSAAAIGSGFILFMNPSTMTDVETAYTALSEYVDLDKVDFIAKASRKKDKYVQLASELDQATADSIKKMQIAGIGVSAQNWRSYPGRQLAAHVLGLTGEDSKSSMITGRYGLERTYEKNLFRKGVGSNANVFAELFGSLNAVFGSRSDEADIVTSIDPTAQKYLEKILSQIESDWKSDEIGGIIMDPKTGEIYAMASLPTFDPNDISGIKNVGILSDPLVEHVYEMGSIMKPLTMAAALDSGQVKLNSTYDDTGTMTLNGKKISNFDGKARGITSMQDILSYSLNLGAANIALKVGKDEFARYFFNFGLGDKTGIDQPNEAAGLVGNLMSGRDIEIATAAYGQGIAMSPINITRALATLANGGYVVTPHLVKEIDYADGRIEYKKYDRKGPYLKQETASEVARMLVKVVDEKIAEKHPNIHWPNYSIAAKTGTAQIPDHKNGGYYSDRYLHSFFGYFPAYDPQFIVFLYHVYPKGAEYASETLSDPFSDIVKFLINYYNVAPDR